MNRSTDRLFQWQQRKNLDGSYSVTNEGRSGLSVSGYFVCADEESAKIACEHLNSLVSASGRIADLQAQLAAKEQELEEVRAERNYWHEATTTRREMYESLYHKLTAAEDQARLYEAKAALADELAAAWKPIQYIDTDSKLGVDWLARYDALTPTVSNDGATNS